MANPLVTEIFVEFVDESGDTTRRSFYVDAGTSTADIVLFIPALVQLIEPLILGGITGAGFTVSVDISALNVGIAQALSDIEEAGTFIARTVNNFIFRRSIPTLDESKVSAGTDMLNVADADVAAFRLALVGGIDLTGSGGSGVVRFTDNHGDIVDSNVGAVEDFL